MKYYKFIDDETDPLIPLFNSDRVLSYLKFKAGIPFNYLDDLKFILKNMLGTISYKDFDYIGGWSPQLSNNISRKSIETKARFYFYDENREVNVSPIALESIRRIFSLSSSVQVIVINTPKHKIFRQHVPKKIKQKYDSIIENAIDNGQIQYIDYSDFVLNDINFYDGDHLNKSGSDIFSKTLSSDIKKSFLKKQN